MASACTSGQIGGEVGYGDATLETLGVCDVARETTVAPDDAELPFDLGALIAELDGLHAVESLAWGQSLAPSVVLAPEPATSSITVDIEYVAGSARRIDRERPEDLASSETADECGPLLAFDAKLTISAENGAIDDEFLVVFAAHSPHLATAATDFEPREVDGAFELDLNGDTRDDLQGARLQIAWADGQLSGSLSAHVSAEDEAVSTALEIARFPSDGCDAGYDLPADSPLTQNAQQTLSALDEFDLTWPDDATTQLTLTHEFGHACLTPWGETTALVLDLTTTAISADGGIDGEWALLASISFDDEDEPTWVDVTRADTSTFEPDEFASETGITGITPSGDARATFTLQLTDDTTDERVADGMVVVFESRPAVCDPAPDEPTGGGGVAPGCAGDQLIEVDTAFLTLAE